MLLNVQGLNILIMSKLITRQDLAGELLRDEGIDLCLDEWWKVSFPSTHSQKSITATRWRKEVVEATRNLITVDEFVSFCCFQSLARADVSRSKVVSSQLLSIVPST